MPLRVATWNLFHGRSEPPLKADLLPAFARGLALRPWDVVGLQEVPPWWPAALGERLGASARTTRTSLLRASLPGCQEAVHRRDPEYLGVKGAAVNALLVRPAAGVIVDHRSAVLRRAPQRRTVQAVRLLRPSGEYWWVANVHTHNKPESKAAADTILALRLVAGWAGDERVVLLGDLNLKEPAGLARVEGYDLLHGHRVDHVLGRGVQAAGETYADRVQPEPNRTLSDHRLVGVRVEPVA